jgi:hypothetical protein
MSAADTQTAKVAKESRKPNPARGSKPGERRGGRTKGVPNKLTGDLRAMILGALNKAGGERYLLTQAADNPNAFLTLVGKCLPKEVTGEGGTPLFPSTINVIGIKPQ